MDLQCCIDLLSNRTTDRRKIMAARSLASHTGATQVMDALCEAAVTTDSYAVREVLIGVLRSNPAGAWRRFSDIALWSRNAVSRKWALVNLSLMECREAKDAVISGLHDPDAAVRRAAAMSAGLYTDWDVQQALELYFERHRFALTLSCVADGLNAIRADARRRVADDPAMDAVDLPAPGVMAER